MESRGSSESRVVLVTGASRGLGRAIAVGFGAIGARVVVNYRTNADEADRTVKAVEDAGGSAFAYQADVRDAKNVAAMVSAAVDRWHRLDVLVCNAAASDDSLLLRLSDEAWDRVLATTLTGVFLCLQSAGAVMQAQGDGVTEEIYAEDRYHDDSESAQNDTEDAPQQSDEHEYADHRNSKLP